MAHMVDFAAPLSVRPPGGLKPHMNHKPVLAAFHGTIVLSGRSQNVQRLRGFTIDAAGRLAGRPGWTRSARWPSGPAPLQSFAIFGYERSRTLNTTPGGTVLTLT